MVPILNWIAPSTISAGNLEAQTNLVTQVVNSGELHLGLLFPPLHSYPVGYVWMLQHQAFKSLTQRGFNIDNIFALKFSGKCDSRDARPALYPGRFLIPASVKPHMYEWRHSSLWNDTYTEPAKMLPAHEMRVPEDLDERALPDTSCITNTIVGLARKFMQIGDDAAEKVMMKLMAGIPLPKIIITQCPWRSSRSPRPPEGDTQDPPWPPHIGRGPWHSIGVPFQGAQGNMTPPKSCGFMDSSRLRRNDIRRAVSDDMA